MKQGNRQIKLKIYRLALRALKIEALETERTVSDIVAGAVADFPEIDDGVEDDSFHVTSLSVPMDTVGKLDRIARAMFTSRNSALLIVISWHLNRKKNP